MQVFLWKMCCSDGVVRVHTRATIHAFSSGMTKQRMIREQEPKSLLPRLEDATKSGIEALKQFAKGIRQDLDLHGKERALMTAYGQTEGQVNRLKLIRRQMYGRASFALLRK